MQSFARTLIIVLALLPVLASVHAARAADGGSGPPWPEAETLAATSYGWHCPPSEQDASESCCLMPCGARHSGCCPLLVLGIELPEPTFAVPHIGAEPAFASLRKPPPLPPPIARLPTQSPARL